MAITKVVLDVTLPGNVMYTKEAAKVSPKEFTDHQAVWVEYQKYSKENKKKETVNECLHIFTRKCIPAHQSVNISVEAYEYMTSKESCINGFKKNIWDGMSKRQRLEAHLNLYCQDLGGINFTYDILPD